MQQGKGLIIVMAMLMVASLVGIFVIIYFEKKRKDTSESKKFAKYYKWYKRFMENSFTRSSFKRVYEQIANLGIYTAARCRMMAVQFYVITYLICIVLLIVQAFIFKDIISFILMCLYVSIMRNVLVTKRINSVRYTLIKEFSAALSSIYETYTRVGNIPEALHECQKGTTVAASIEEIGVIVSSTDSADLLDKFYDRNPFKQIKTLASTCYILNDVGDATSRSGESAFKDAVLAIKSEVDLEQRKMLQQRLAFGIIEYLPVVPIFFTGMLQSFFIKYIPATAVIYNGMLGYVMRVALVLSSLIGYYVCTTITNAADVVGDDRSPLITALLRYKPIRKFVKNIEPKKAKDLLKFSKKLKGSLSMKTMDHIYCAKALFSLVCFIFSFIATIYITYVAKDFTYKNVKSLSLVAADNLTVAEEEGLYKLDCELLALDYLPTDEELLNRFGGILPKATELDKLDQVDRIKSKYDTYHSLGYKWWYVLIAYLVAIVGWQIPDVQLKLRAYLVKTEAEEDIMQMQTIATILMNTPLDTLEVIYWLEKNSTIHKEILTFCYHEYPSDPEMAINRMKSKSTIPIFVQLCDKLLAAATDIELQDAFSDLVVDREHLLKTREAVQTAAIHKRRRLASPLALAPIIILAVGIGAAPIGVLGYKSLVSTLSQL